jgi:hypothetical protein
MPGGSGSGDWKSSHAAMKPNAIGNAQKNAAPVRRGD